MSSVAKTFVKAQRRCLQPQEMYYRLYQSEVDAIFTQEMADYVKDKKKVKDDDEEEKSDVEEGDDEGDVKPNVRSRGWNLSLRRKIFTREWENASDERKALVMEELEKERAQIALETNLENAGKGLARPAELRKRLVLPIGITV